MIRKFRRRAFARIPAERKLRIRQTARRLSAPVRLGALRRTTPLSDHWGYDRGTPVDRHYVHRFLGEHRADITGCVLEVMDPRYTERFGVDVERSDVLDVDPVNPRATIVADLTSADEVESDAFDCFVLTQTLQFVYDVPAAIRTVRRILRPGGTVLATLPAASRISRRAPENEYWRFTSASARRLFADEFGPEHVEVASYGNVLATIAFLAGMAREELRPADLDVADPHFPLIIGVRAVKR